MPLHTPRANRRRANSHPVVQAGPRNRSDLPTPSDTSPFPPQSTASGSSTTSSLEAETINESEGEPDLPGDGNAWTSRIPALPVVPSPSSPRGSSTIASRVSYVASLLTPPPIPASIPPTPPTMAEIAAEDRTDLELITSTAYTSRNLRRRGAVHIRRVSGGAGVVGIGFGELEGSSREFVNDARLASSPDSERPRQVRRTSTGGRGPRMQLAFGAIPATRSVPGQHAYTSASSSEEEDNTGSMETYTILCGIQGQQTEQWRPSAVAFSSDRSSSSQTRAGCGAIVTAAARFVSSSSTLRAPSSQTNAVGSSRIYCSIWYVNISLTNKSLLMIRRHSGNYVGYTLGIPGTTESNRMRHPTDIDEEEGDCVFEQGNVDVYPALPLPSATPPISTPTMINSPRFAPSPSPTTTPRPLGSSLSTPRMREDQVVGYWNAPSPSTEEPSSYVIDVGQGVRRTVTRTATDDAIDAIEVLDPRNDEVMAMMRERFGWSGMSRLE